MSGHSSPKRKTWIYPAMVGAIGAACEIAFTDLGWLSLVPVAAVCLGGGMMAEISDN
jgi:hypothetical protein